MVTETTLLRIKRKRTEDAIEALIVSSTIGKKVKSGERVFKLMESVTTSSSSTYSKYTKPKTLPQATPETSEVLSSKKLNEAKNERFKIVSENKHRVDDTDMKVVDIQRDEDFGVDQSILELMPMVREHLRLTRMEEEEFIYDIYMHDTSQFLSNKLLSQKIGTLEMDFENNSFLNEDESNSDYDSEDSNGIKLLSSRRLLQK
jgi:hypothetical protein